MPIFQSDTRAALKRLADKAFETSQERDQLLAQLAAAEGLRAKDVTWMLFCPDPAYRDAVVGLLKRLADPVTVDAVLAECRGKPEASVHPAAATLFALGVPGTEQRLAHVAVHGKGEPQEIVCRLLLDEPVTPSLEPVLWQLAGAGRAEDRLAFPTRLATALPTHLSSARRASREEHMERRLPGILGLQIRQMISMPSLKPVGESPAGTTGRVWAGGPAPTGP